MRETSALCGSWECSHILGKLTSKNPSFSMQVESFWNDRY